MHRKIFAGGKIVTKTMVKNGSRVEEAAYRLALAGEGHNWLRVNVAAVAKECHMSKPTVTKYMRLLVEHGVFTEEKRDMRYCSKNTPITFRLSATLRN